MSSHNTPAISGWAIFKHKQNTWHCHKHTITLTLQSRYSQHYYVSQRNLIPLMVSHYTTTSLEFIFIQYSNSKDVKQREEHERKLRTTTKRSNSLGWRKLSWLLDNPFKSGNVEGGECIILLIRNAKCYRSEQTCLWQLCSIWHLLQLTHCQLTSFLRCS